MIDEDDNVGNSRYTREWYSKTGAHYLAVWSRQLQYTYMSYMNDNNKYTDKVIIYTAELQGPGTGLHSSISNVYDNDSANNNNVCLFNM
jgi:hypothetical protein